MDTGGRLAWGNIGHVEDKVSDLSIAVKNHSQPRTLSLGALHASKSKALKHTQYIGSSKAEDSACLVLVAIDQTEPTEVRSGSEDWKAVWVSNNLSEVVVDDRGRDDINSGGEVNNSGRRRGRFTFPWSTSVSAADGIVDGSSIIGHTIT